MEKLFWFILKYYLFLIIIPSAGFFAWGYKRAKEMTFSGRKEAVKRELFIFSRVDLVVSIVLVIMGLAWPPLFTPKSLDLMDLLILFLALILASILFRCIGLSLGSAKAEMEMTENSTFD